MHVIRSLQTKIVAHLPDFGPIITVLQLTSRETTKEVLCGNQATKNLFNC